MVGALATQCPRQSMRSLDKQEAHLMAWAVNVVDAEVSEKEGGRRGAQKQALEARRI